MLRMEFQELYWENKSSVFLDNIEFPIDVLVRNKNFVRNLEIKDLCDFDKDGLDLDRETVDDIGFIETIFHRGMSKSALDSPGFGVSSGEISDSSINKVTSTSIINLGHSTKEMGFGTVFEHNNEKESMIGKELDKYADSKEVSSMLSSEESLISSLMEHSLPTKRARNTGLYPQIPICQVQGCYKDLSSSKDYYKRHRVCDIHSKTAKVVINGIEQRFCQQCSRFHLLVEFDNGKRSCRKRLAGHNERRRKPQLGAHLGSRFFEMTLLRSTSFRSSETLPGSFYYQERNVCYDHSSKHIKLEQVPIDISQLAEPENGQSPSNSRPILHLIRNQHYLETCNDGPVELELPMLPDSRCALSLLSANSHNNHSMGVSKRTSPSTRENQNTLVGVYQKSAKAFTGNRHFSSGTQNQVGSPMVRSGFQKDGHIQTSDYTMDLFQLSSHLQRVEKLKSDMQMKQESYSSS